MQKDVKLENDGEIKEFQEYSRDKLAIAKVCVLSTAPNSHELDISEEVLRRDIGSIRGNFLVANMVNGDAQSHDAEEVPVGYFIPDKDIEFEEVEENGQKIVKAWAFAVLSKQYAKEAYNMFVNDNHRATSIEMKVELGKDEHEVLSFDAYGSTILGLAVRPSCKDAEISLVRFAEQAQEFFEQQSDSLSQLKNFIEERKTSMAENKYVSHSINTSKDAVYTGDWDGNKAKQDLIKEKNYKSLAPEVCLKLEEGWENREVTKLGYPVMGLYDGEWRYSTKAIASAQAYAEQNDETEVLNKIKKIKKSLGLDDDSKGKEEKMSIEIEFSAVNIGDLWGQLWHIIDETRHWEYGISGIYEEDNKKFAILIDRDKKLYRLDFSLTEDGMTVSDEVVEVKQEFTETDNMRKFAEPENVAEYRFADDDDEPDIEDMKAKLAKLEADIADRDHIIMDKDAELEELRKFKAEVEEQRKAAMVESVMADCKEYMSAEQFAETRDEGMACKPEELDAWSNRAKAVCFSAVKKSAKKAPADNGVWGFAAPINPNKSNGLWD